MVYVAILGANAGIQGYIAIKGSADQLAALRENEEYQRNLIDASLIVDGLAVADGSCDEGIAADMVMYREAVGKVPQTA